MTRKMVAVALALSLLWTVSIFAQGAVPADSRKHTPQGKYLTAKEAYEKWIAEPKGMTIIDGRTPEEYVYIGHPAMAINIPFQTWTGKFNSEKKDVGLSVGATY